MAATVTMAMSNGHLSGMDMAKRAKNGTNEYHITRPHSHDEVKRLCHKPHIKGLNDVKRSSSENAKTNFTNTSEIKLRSHRQPARTQENRNGCIFDQDSLSRYNNNNGPSKILINKEVKSSDTFKYNTNNSGLPRPSSSSDLSSSSPSSCSNSPLRRPNARIPLQRINGHTNMKPLRPVPANFAESVTEKQPTSFAEFVNRRSALSSTASESHSPSKPDLSVTYGPSESDISVTSRDTVTFAENPLPPGMQEIYRNHFSPGSKAHFQRKTQLPLLIGTDAAILKRRSSFASKRKYRTTAYENLKKTKKYQQKHRRGSGGALPTRSQSNSSDHVHLDKIIIETCWSTILAFMSDDKSPRHHKHHGSRLLGSIVSSKRKYLVSKRTRRRSSSDYTRRSSGSSSSSRENFTKPVSASQPNSPTIDSKGRKDELSKTVQSVHQTRKDISNLTVLEKVHFLINVGLELPFLRDELYCLVMKQLIGNPSSQSEVFGWILLALMMSIFPPSHAILPFIRQFVQHQAHAWGAYCLEQLDRTVENGERANPPCSFEILAAKSREKILLPIICPDQSLRTVTVDAASTSKEIIMSVAEKNRIKDSFGFCIVLCAEGKVSPRSQISFKKDNLGEVVNLGSGTFPIMDALSQVEQQADLRLQRLSWRLYYRRDLFSPRGLHNANTEHMTAWLTFSQICGGIQCGEYVCAKAQDLALLVAHQYCIRHGAGNIEMRRIMSLCERCLPNDVYKDNKKNWCLMIENTLHALAKKAKKFDSPFEIMDQVLRYAMHSFSQQFLRKYNITTFGEVGGACTYTSELAFSICHQGLTVKQGDALTMQPSADTGDREVVTVPVVLLEVPVAELKKVKLETKSNIKRFLTTLTITILGGRSYDITSAHGHEIYSILFRYIRETSKGLNNESDA